MTNSTNLLETVFHECYDENKHSNDEKAVRFDQYAKELLNTIIKINTFSYLENGSNFTKINSNDIRILDNTEETEEIYQRVKTFNVTEDDNAEVFNEIMVIPGNLILSKYELPIDEPFPKLTTEYVSHNIFRNKYVICVITVILPIVFDIGLCLGGQSSKIMLEEILLNRH